MLSNTLLQYILSSLRKKEVIVILLTFHWLVIQIFLFTQFGFKIANDSMRYIDGAHHVINHLSLPNFHDSWYRGYIFFITAIFFIGGGVKTIIVLQVLLSGLATVAVYKTAKNLSLRWEAAALTAFLYLFWIKTHQLNFYVLTESLFTSMIAICFYFCSKTKMSLADWVMSILLFGFTAMVRPTGFALIFSFILFTLFHLFKSNCISKKSMWITALVAIPLSLFLLNRMLTTFTLVETFQRGETIYGYKHLLIDNSHVVLPPAETAPLLKLVKFFFLNPLFLLKLSFAKLFLWTANVKPYFSLGHNLFIVTCLYPIYYFAVKGLILINNYAHKLTALAFIAVQALTIMLTVEDWDGRFLLPIMPVVMVYAGIGFYQWKWPKKFLYTKK